MIKALVFDAYGTLYDVQSVAEAVEAAFPGHGAYLTQVWRLKQLEYSWLRTLMGRYEDFWSITRDSLAYALRTAGLPTDPATLDALAQEYNRLRPYPDAADALRSLSGYRRVILSNGSPAMLSALVGRSGLDTMLEAVLSVDEAGAFKPDRRAYEVVEARLGLPPEAVLFVSSNGFDVAGARSFGFRVARIERVAEATLAAELEGGPAGPATMFKALRLQHEALGFGPDHVLSTLAELPALLRELDGAA